MTKAEFDVRRGFVDLNSNLKVWCETEEQERNVLEYLNSQGYRWRSRENLLERSYDAPLGLHIWGGRKDVTFFVEDEFSSGALSVDEFLEMLPFMERRII